MLISKAACLGKVSLMFGLCWLATHNREHPWFGSITSLMNMRECVSIASLRRVNIRAQSSSGLIMSSVLRTIDESYRLY